MKTRCISSAFYLPLGLALLFFSLPTCCRAGELQNTFDRGLEAYRSGKYADAAALMAVAEKESPGATEALLLQGRAFLALDDLASADRSLRSYLEAHANSSETMFLLGYVLHRENKPAESLKMYTRGASFRRPSSEDLRFAGLDYVLLNDYPDAIHWLEISINFDSRNIEAWYALGRCYYSQSEFAEGERAFRHVLQLNPAHVKGLENLGLVLDAENKIPEADDAFRQAVQLADRDSGLKEWPYLDYGSFLVEHDRMSDAVPILESAVKRAPRCAACHEKLGRAYAATSNVDRGVAELETAISLDPQNPMMHFELSRIYRRAGRADLAKTEAEQSSRLYGTRATPETK